MPRIEQHTITPLTELIQQIQEQKSGTPWLHSLIDNQTYGKLLIRFFYNISSDSSLGIVEVTPKHTNPKLIQLYATAHQEKKLLIAQVTESETENNPTTELFSATIAELEEITGTLPTGIIDFL